MSRLAIYSALNIGLIAAVTIAGSVNGASPSHAVYISALFALCSLPVLDLDGLHGRRLLLAAFSSIYFMQFGLLDTYQLLFPAHALHESARPISEAEWVLLVGALVMQLAYRAAGWAWSPVAKGPGADWPAWLMSFGGLAIWFASTWMAWTLNVEIISDATQATARAGLARFSEVQVLAYMFAAYAQPLSIVMVAYAYCRRGARWLAPFLAFIVVAQLFLGFVSNTKSTALMGALLIVLTRVLATRRIPTFWVIGSVAFLALVYPVLVANRVAQGTFNVSHVEAAQDVWKNLDRALAAVDTSSKGPDRTQNFFERMSLKGSVDMIVTQTGNSVAYREGYTLWPLLTVFIPRIVWPEKPDVQTGLLVTSDFRVSESRDLYTSPSFIGEMYWNFGWSGVVVGMAILGLMLGLVGSAAGASPIPTLTTVLVVMVTLKQLVLLSESTIAAPVAVWIRSMAMIGACHLLVVRRSGAARSEPVPEAKPTAAVRYESFIR